MPWSWQPRPRRPPATRTGGGSYSWGSATTGGDVMASSRCVTVGVCGVPRPHLASVAFIVLYSVYYELKSVCSTQCTIVCMLYSVYYSLYATQCTIVCMLYSVYYELKSVCSTQCTIVCMLYSVYYELKSVCSTQCTIVCMLYSVYYELKSVCSNLCTVAVDLVCTVTLRLSSSPPSSTSLQWTCFSICAKSM